ncbi:MAG: hypothetical protein ABI346_04375 [Candidatus Baltobacteraceae bacterium]
MTWALIGLAVTLGAMLVALLRARGANRSFYEVEVYGMTTRSHRRFALFSLAFALAFAARLVWSTIPTVALLTIYTVALLLYAASFARGASDPDS